MWQQTLGGKTLIPADVLFGFQPWKAAAAQFGIAYPQNHLVADLVLENYAWKRFIIESLKQGEIPLWNPYTFAGEPFLANGQHSALYPFSLIFYVLPLWQAYGWFTVSQLWLAGVWMYLLARVLGLRRASAIIAAVTYQLSAFFVFSVVFTMVIAAAAWLPFILAMTELVIRQHPALGGRPARAPWAVLGALGLGIAMLAGHPEMIYPYTLFVVGTFAAWRLAATWQKHESRNLHKLLDCGVAGGDGRAGPGAGRDPVLADARNGYCSIFAKVGQFAPGAELVVSLAAHHCVPHPEFLWQRVTSRLPGRVLVADAARQSLW